MVYDTLGNISFGSLTIESRADVITADSLHELRCRFTNPQISVELGVETLNNWLLRFAINKGLSTQIVNNAVSLIHAENLYAIANIGIGIPFISEQENITQTTQSIMKAFEMGFDTVIIFPYHIKPGTLLEVLSANNRYECVSLWSLIEVLSLIPCELFHRVNISWYKNYYTDKSKIIASPTTCKHCESTILELLDSYKANPCSETLNELINFNCDCRELWRNKLSDFPDYSIDKIYSDYAFLHEHFNSDKEDFLNIINQLCEAEYA
jgi:radical SAM enzyme (TIGR01210 family)